MSTDVAEVAERTAQPASTHVGAIGGFMSVLDSSVVNVAVPFMQMDVGASSDDIEWVATAYSLSLGVVVPVSAWLGEWFGMRRVYLVSLVALSPTSALHGFAWDLTASWCCESRRRCPAASSP
jgi:MFS family permease